MAPSRDKLQADRTNPNEQLCTDVRSAFAALGYSPEDKIRKILTQCHPHFQDLVRCFAQKMLALTQLAKLDKVIVNRNISSGDASWVSNTRRLTENALEAELLEIMVEVHQMLESSDVMAEVWSILREPYEKLMQQRADAEAAALQAKLAALQGMGNPMIIGGPQPAAAPGNNPQAQPIGIPVMPGIVGGPQITPGPNGQLPRYQPPRQTRLPFPPGHTP